MRNHRHCVSTDDLDPASGDDGYSVRARSSTSNTSRLSPGLMSLVSASSTPHSRPGATSATSSLKRRSELIVVFETMTSSRVRRALRPLRMTPSSDEQAGGLVLLAGREDFLDLGAADDRLDDLGPELARHRALHPVGQVIDDVVIAELDLVALGDLARLGVGADVEADDRRAARGWPG